MPLMRDRIGRPGCSAEVATGETTGAMTGATGETTGATGETTGATGETTGAMTGKTVGVAGLDCSGSSELDDQWPAAGDASDRPGGRARPGRCRSRRGGRAQV